MADIPRREIQRDMENEGPQGLKKPLDLKGTRHELHKRYGEVLGKIDTARDQFANHRVKNFVLRRSDKVGHKKFIEHEARQTVQQKLDEMKDLTAKGKWNLQRLSQRSADRLAFLSRKHEIASDILAAVEFKREELSRQRELFKTGNQALNQEHRSWKSRFRGNYITLDPFNAMGLPDMEAAAKEAQGEALKEKNELTNKQELKFKNMRTIEGSLRESLLNYNPRLASKMDQLLRDNAAGKPDLDNEIRKLFPSSPLNRNQQIELDNLLLWAAELRSPKGRNAELFRRLGIAEVSGKADVVFPELAKLPLGGRVRLSWPSATGYDGWKPNKMMEFRVWTTAHDGRITLIPARKVSITGPVTVPGTPPVKKSFSPHERGEIVLDSTKKIAWLAYDNTKLATDKDRYQKVPFKDLDIALVA